jgi:hypothetical protein
LDRRTKPNVPPRPIQLGILVLEAGMSLNPVVLGVPVMAADLVASPRKFTASKLRKTKPRDLCFGVLWIAPLGLSMSPTRGDPMCSLSATNLVVVALVDGLGVRGEDPKLDLCGGGSFILWPWCACSQPSSVGGFERSGSRIRRTRQSRGLM